MSWENCQIKEKLGISKERVGHIISHLGFWKVCAPWVPRKLTNDIRAERVTVSRIFLGHFEQNGEEFLWWIVIGDETWVHHCDPENKRQSMEYCHNRLLAQNKFCCNSWVDCIRELWWCCAHWLPGKGATVNSECYIETLKKSQKCIMRKGAEMLASARPYQASHKCCQVMPLHVWGLQCYHIQSTACIFLLVISSCSPNQRKTSGAKFSVLMKKSRPMVMGEKKN